MLKLPAHILPARALDSAHNPAVFFKKSAVIPSPIKYFFLSTYGMWYSWGWRTLYGIISKIKVYIWKL